MYLRGLDRNHWKIEATGCVVNIRDDLRDVQNRKVTSITVYPDPETEQPGWMLRGYHNTRVVQLKHFKKQRKSNNCS